MFSTSPIIMKISNMHLYTIFEGPLEAFHNHVHRIFKHTNAGFDLNKNKLVRNTHGFVFDCERQLVQL